MKRLLLLLFAIMVTFISVNAQDVIRLKNGNQINGELKSMERAVLTMKTDYSDSDFKVEWEKLVYIKTKSIYIIYLSKEKMASLIAKDDSLGDRINSTLTSDPNNSKKIILNTINGKRSVYLDQVVFLKSFNETFISRLSASVDVGLNATKANNLKQLNISSSLGYVADKWGSDGSFNLVDSKQDSIARVHRLDAHIGFNWYLPKNFYLSLSSDWLENDELNLDLRTTIKTGLGFFILRTNHLYWKVEGGFAYNNELYFEDSTVDTDTDSKPRRSDEAYFGTEVNLFDIKDLSVLTRMIVYPGLSDRGRFRYDFKFEVKYDLPLDLYIKAGTTVNYDNRPVGDAYETDYVINTGLGWEL